MDGLYGLFNADSDTVAQERAAALQAMLRGNQQASGLAALSGSKALQPFAAMTGGMAKQQGDALTEAGTMQFKALLQKRQHQEDRRLHEQDLADNRAFRHQEGELTRAAMAERAKQGGHGRPSIQKLADGTMVAVDPDTGQAIPVLDAQGRPMQARDTDLETGAQKFGADIQYLTSMPRDVEMLKQYGGKDVPGMGPLAGWLPAFATSNEGQDVRQAAQRLMNTLVYMQSGKVINENEMVRMLEARGLGTQATSHQFASGITTLEEDLRKAAKLYRAKYEPRAIGAVRSRGGLDGLQEWFPEDPAEKATGGTLGAPLQSTTHMGAAPAAPAAQKRVVRRGTDEQGNRVAQFDDGSVGPDPGT